MTLERRLIGRAAALALVAGAAGLVYAGLADDAPSPHGPGAPAGALAPAVAGSGGTAACADCHEDVVSAFAANPHSQLADRWAGKTHDGNSCTGCHGNPTAHLDSGGDEGPAMPFGDNVAAAAKRAACLNCHGQQMPLALKSPHGRGNMDCTQCHGVHGEGASLRPSAREISAGCNECHQSVFTQFAFTEHHRLQEGVMSCVSCHNPHEPAQRVNLGGFKQEACTSCHQETAGPFVFEHGANRVTGCTSCHEAHGSLNRHQLKFQRVADLCYSCHNVIPSFHRGFDFATQQPRFNSESQCTSCHSTIHGSNFDPAFLR